MTLDPATQAIARFIGLFGLTVEELRLRQDYLEFRLKRSQEDDAPPPEPVGVHIQAPYQIGQFDPRLDYEPVAPELPPVQWAASSPELEVDVPAPPAPEALPDDAPATVAMALVIELPPPPPFGFLLEPAASIVSVTIQSVTLSDDDLFLSGLGTRFTDPAELKAELDAIAARAETLAGFAMPDMPADGDWIGFAEEMLAQLDAAGPAGGAASTTTLRGDEAEGIFVDGTAVDEAPDWTDLLPEYLRPEEPPEPATAGTAGEDGSDGDRSTDSLTEHDFSRDFRDDTPLPGGLEPGAEIVAGANKAINEVAVSSNWIDAPVIVVRGDVAKFDAISQVNVLVEHDRIDGAAAGQASFATNIAEITEVSSEDAGAPPPSSDVLPQGWQVVRIEADLLQVNWVKQFTFATDFDRAEVIVSGSATFLGLGENQIVNSTILNEFGYNFDLIFVGGDMVDATVVSQKNVLFDSDTVITGERQPQMAQQAPEAGPPGAPAAIEAAFEVATQEPAPAQHGAPDPAEASLEEEVGGDAPESEAAMAPSAEPEAVDPLEAAGGAIPPQVSEPLDNGPDEPEPIEAAAATDVSEPEVAEPEAPPPLSLADNLLLNQATIKTTGVDTFVEMTEKFAATAQKLAEGAETISREVAQDAMFAGKEALRILQIDGDLAKVNLFEQTNIVGDADQIRLEMLALRDQLETEMKLIAGSNALVNLATAIEHGMDSKVMAGGHVYDDAFIHQAELFDTDSAPSGVKLSALANEAVAAFLSEDMTKLPALEDEIVPQGNYEAPSQVDVMQTVLA